MAEAVSPSDVRMKKNIQLLNASLKKVSMLEEVSFDWRTEEYLGFPEKVVVVSREAVNEVSQLHVAWEIDT